MLDASARPRLLPNDVLPTLLLILPLGLGGAVSPVMLTEQAVLLSANGARAAVRFAAGVVLASVLIVSVLVFFGRVIALPTEPNLDASLDIVIGLVLLAGACLTRALGRRKREPPTTGEASHSGSRGTRAAFPFGVFSMATNASTIALIAPAAKEISTAGVGLAGRAALVAVLVGLVSSPAWVPLALVKVAPDSGQRVLDAVRALIDRYGRAAIVALLGVAGLFFVVRGIVRLIA